MGRIRKLTYWLTIPCGRRGGYAAAAPSLDDGAWFKRASEANADQDRITLGKTYLHGGTCPQYTNEWHCPWEACAEECQALQPCERDQVNVSTFEAGGDDVYIPGSCLTHWWTGGCDSR